ncbi:hypothetical protein [Mucilaginibacter jinjuensis]|uniref:YD repeat-containing protein n=1 Tax=Mucilaginibacter jinjuensis TaxID=1176721 RepID=A0ABY7T485_9SPHI|nr:hypothetical protein [Mucilaginibacter jinjuensis]WCT11270.1 hypothetical protein PQO05_21250 [Mucilaginibacter jinjuensis]
MKLLISAILILTVQYSTRAQTTRTLLQGEILYGKVKKIAEMQYRERLATEQPTIFNSAVTDTTFYDENGNTTERHVKANGVIYNFVYTTEFDKRGKKLKTTCDKGVLTYDKKGNMIKFDQYDKAGGNFIAEDKHKYDSHNNMIEFTSYNNKGYLTFKKVFKYNDKNQPIEEKNYANDGTLSYTVFYTYNAFDENGNWTQRTLSDKFENGAQGSPLITTRQITYYQ